MDFDAVVVGVGVNRLVAAAELQEVPFRPSGDAAGSPATGNGWDERLTDGYVPRVLDLIEEQAPGTTAAVRGWSALTPADLARVDVDCVQGDPYCGAAELDQSLLWRSDPAIARRPDGGSRHLAARSLLGGRTSAARRLLPARHSWRGRTRHAGA